MSDRGLEQPEAGAPSPWPPIAGSPFYGAYVYELAWLARDVVERFDRLRRSLEAPKPGSSYIKVDHDLLSDLYALLGNAGKIRQLIQPRRRQRQDQSDDEYAVLCERTAALRRELDGLSLDTVLNGIARNSVEHFDERLDKLALAISRGEVATPVHLPLDMIVWDRGVFEVLRGTPKQPSPDIYPLRVYVASEEVFLNAEAELSLRDLRSECAAIVERLASQLPPDDQRGAFVLVITRETFQQAD